jgi:hypothetical protein
MLHIAAMIAVTRPCRFAPRRGIESTSVSQPHRQRDAAAACPPFKRNQVGSTPTAGTSTQASSNGRMSGRLPEDRGGRPAHEGRRASTAPHSGASRLQVLEPGPNVGEVLSAARLPRKQEDRVRLPASAPSRCPQWRLSSSPRRDPLPPRCSMKGKPKRGRQSDDQRASVVIALG